MRKVYAKPYYELEAPKGAIFLMGYSSVSEEGICEGIRRLAEIANG